MFHLIPEALWVPLSIWLTLLGEWCNQSLFSWRIVASFATSNFRISPRELSSKGGNHPSSSDMCLVGGRACAPWPECDWLHHLPLIRHCDITAKWTYNVIDGFCLMITFTELMIMRQWQCLPWRWIFYLISYDGLGECMNLIGSRVSINPWLWAPSKSFQLNCSSF